MAQSNDRYTLYGVEGSYYAAKVRSYLLQKRLRFDEVRTDRHVFEHIIIPRIGYPIVPVVVTPSGETLLDSAVIIERLESHHPEHPLVPSAPARRFAAYLLELYADEWLKIPALHYRWYYDESFATQMMGENNDPNASPAEQLRVGKKIAAGFKSWPQHLGANKITYPAIEAWFVDTLYLLEKHFATHLYFLGNSPTLADCAMMGPLYAHIYRDPYSGQIVRKVAPRLCAWIKRMRSQNISARSDDNQSLPATMKAFLEFLSRDYVPTAEAAAAYITANLPTDSAGQLPRYLGEHEFTLGRDQPYQITSSRSIHAIEQWKVQRLVEMYKQSPTSQQVEIESLFRAIGASSLLTLQIPISIKYHDYRLVQSTAA